MRSFEVLVPRPAGRGRIAAIQARTFALLLSYQEQMLAWQREAVSAVFAGISLYQSAALAAVAQLSAFPARHEAQVQKLIGLADTWLRLVTDMHAALFHALNLSLASRDPDGPADAMAERRVRSVVINFPERRIRRF